VRLIATVNDGALVNERRDEQHVHPHGFTYLKARAMIGGTHDDDRVLQPLRPIRQPGQFAPVSWNGSMNNITTVPADIREQHGTAAYELYVIASAVDEVVRSVGGWLFDRVRVRIVHEQTSVDIGSDSLSPFSAPACHCGNGRTRKRQAAVGAPRPARSVVLSLTSNRWDLR
jgi:hypothetical protein